MDTNKAIIVIADVWGAAHGGINSFNLDLTLALGRVMKGYAKIICAVKKAITDSPQVDLDNVELIVFSDIQEGDPFDERWVDKLYRRLEKTVSAYTTLWWVGHDVHTGPLAAALKREFKKGKLALIKHMSYISYQSYKADSANALEKDRIQRTLFKSADHAFAVGPLLLKELKKHLKPRQESISIIVPGLAEIETDYSDNPFTAIIYGRLDTDNNRVKQFRLAMHAFAAAVRKAEDPGYPAALKEMPCLIAIGLPTDDPQKEKRLRSEINEKAARVFQFQIFPYTENRSELFFQLTACSVALVPSWHEGFGLAGWEAIAAEIPLIIGKNTGLYQLIDDKLGDSGTVLLRGININGAEGDDNIEDYSELDLQRVRDAIVEVARDPVRANKNAKKLKRDLNGLGFTWKAAARDFALALDFTEIHKNPAGFLYEETERYASPEVKETLLENGYTSFFAIDDSIRLVSLDLNGRSYADADNLKVEYRSSSSVDVQVENTNLQNKELYASVESFAPNICDYLRTHPFFKADSTPVAEWKLGMEKVQPPLEMFEKSLQLTVRPLSFITTRLFNRRIINGRVAIRANRPDPDPELMQLYKESIKYLLSNNEIFDFRCPSQIFIELAVLTADAKTLLVQKTAGEPGSGVVAEIRRSWTCGPEFGLTFKHLGDDSILLHPAVLSSMKSEFGVDASEVKYWHISGLALQHVHLNMALYGYCEVSLTGEELVDRFRETKNRQFRMTLQGPKPYPELLNVYDIPDILDEEPRYNGESWHPTAKIRLLSLYRHYPG